jgi:hypothetical protein
MLQRCLLLVFLFVLCCTNLANAETVKSGDLLVISGGNSSEYWEEKDKTPFNNQQSYFALGAISLVPRSQKNCPLEVEIWGRGVSTTAFFDLTPLVGVLEGTASGDDVRRLLVVENHPANSPGQPSDRDALLAVIQRTKNTGKTEALTLKRQIAFDQMKLFKLTTFDKLWGLYDAQRKLVQESLMTGVSDEKLFKLYEAVVVPADPKPDRNMSSLVNFLRENNLLVPIVRTQLFSTTEPHLIGYVFRLPANSLRKATGQIFVGAGDAEAEALTVSLEMEHLDTIFSSWDKFAGAVVTPTVTGVTGAMLGAVIAFLVFVLQQRYTRRAEIEKKFQEKKIEASQTIRAFFKGEYKRYGEPADNKKETEYLDLIRESLISKGIYATLPRDDVDRLNKICRSTEGAVGARLAKLDDLLASRFKELMD